MKELAGKVAFVTGATGLIGSNLVKRLLEEGAKVIVLGRNREKIADVFINELSNINFSYEVGNISDGFPASVDFVDYIFHAASTISGCEIKNKPIDVIEANIVGTQKCLEFLKNQRDQGQSSGKMIIFSSATIYGSKHTYNRSVSESETESADALNSSNSPYSESKRMVEVLANSYLTQYGVESVIARIGYVYGYTKNKPNTAFYEFIDKALNGKNIVVNNSTTARRDNIFIDDAINGLITIATTGISGETYNISSNGEKDNYKAIDEIAHIIAQTINEMHPDKPISIFMNESENQRNCGVMLNNTKLKNLGWLLETSLQHGIKITLEKYIKME